MTKIKVLNFLRPFVSLRVTYENTVILNPNKVKGKNLFVIIVYLMPVIII